MLIIQVMFETGTLLYFEPFVFPDGGIPKAKYFVVLANVEQNVLLASLPTSKDHVPSDIPLQAGCLELPERMVNVYVFLASVQVTENGFCFPMNTFIYGANIKTYDSELFVRQEQEGMTRISVIGNLRKELFESLKDCLRNSDAVRKRFKQYL